MNYFLIFLIFISTNLFADCEEIYLDRFDLAEKQFADMDIADEYLLAKPRLLKHPNIYKTLLNNIQNLKFSRYKKENIQIIQDLLIKIKNKNLNIQKVINLKYQRRQAFFIKENIKDNDYYSMIFYVNTSCNPFNENNTKKVRLNNINEKKLQNNKR
jgi:hypothetical protein